MKSIIRDIIYIISYLVSYLLKKNKNSKVLYYHDIHSDKQYSYMSTSMDKFERHIEIIKKNGFEIVSNITRTKKQISIMFDDGFRGIYDNKDFFLKNNITPTIFITTSFIGSDNFLTKSEIIELSNLGFNIQSHTVTHQELSKLSDSDLKYELVESKRILEELLDKDIFEICAPKGSYSDNVVKVSKELGYDRFYSSVPGDYFDLINGDNNIVCRNLCQSLDPFNFGLLINGGLKLLQSRYIKRYFTK